MKAASTARETAARAARAVRAERAAAVWAATTPAQKRRVLVAGGLSAVTLSFGIHSAVTGGEPERAERFPGKKRAALCAVHQKMFDNYAGNPTKQADLARYLRGNHCPGW